MALVLGVVVVVVVGESFVDDIVGFAISVRRVSQEGRGERH
jgi:hypothetical protein